MTVSVRVADKGLTGARFVQRSKKWKAPTPSPLFLYECDYRGVEIVCFDRLLQVLILQELRAGSVYKKVTGLGELILGDLEGPRGGGA